MGTRSVEVEAKAEMGTSVEEMETGVEERWGLVSMMREEAKDKTIIRWHWNER